MDWNTPSQALAYYTECELATIEELKSRKRISKYSLRRHEVIASGMIKHCRRFVTASDVDFVSAHRLRVLLGFAEGDQ
jgi:hypothetical protein